MRSSPIRLSFGLGIWLAFASAAAHGQTIIVAGAIQQKASRPAAAEKAAASVHKMVIFEGAHRRVSYIGFGGLSTSDRAAAYELERAENDLAYLRDLQQLKSQYARSERTLEPRRRFVQGQLYGTSIISSGTSGFSSSYGQGGRRTYPYALGGYGWPRSFSGFSASTSASVARGLQYGMGNEGVLKNWIAAEMARDSSPERAAAAAQAFDDAAARAAASAPLSRELALSHAAVHAERGPSFTRGGKVAIWVGSDKYQGTVKDDADGWLVLQTAAGDVSVRKSEITRVEVPTK